MRSVTQQLVGFTQALRFEDLPQKVKHEAKRLLLDSVGCALGGLAADKGKLSVRLARRWGGPAEATIIGMGDKVACPHAAFANGELVNALDYDAIIAASHIPPFVLPALLAVAEKEAATGQDLLLAMAIGYEIAARMAKATTGLQEVIPEGPDGPTMRFPIVHGYSGAVFGAVAGAGKILNLNEEGLLSALGIGGTITPLKNMPKWYNTPPAAMSKYTMAGWVSQAGVTSVYLAQMGYSGIRDILDGEDGFWKFSGSQKWDPGKLTADLGKEWYFVDIDYKPYPCCRAMHGGLDCFYQILAADGLKAEDIKEINLLLHPLAEMPIWRSQKITNHVAAQFSVAYVFAVAAHRVSLSMWQDPQTMQDPKILGFMPKVKWVPHPSFAQELLKDPHCRPVAVEVVTKGGKKIRRETKYIKGASIPQEFALTDEELIKKFKENAQKYLAERNFLAAIERIFDLENVPRVHEVTACLSLV